MMNKIIKYIKHPKYILLKLDALNIIRLNDKVFVSWFYERAMNKKLNLDNPTTFNEKLQWLKLYDRKDIYTKMVDKYEAKDYVASIIGKEYIIPTLGVYNSFDEIEFDKLPNQFVIKCTHDSGGLVIVKDKNKLDINKARNKINESLKNNYYYAGREWPYKNVKPRIIIEKYMQDNLVDYKLFCFNGICKYILVCSNRKAHNKNTDFYDTNWNLAPFNREFSTHNVNGFVRPLELEEMISIAKKLSNNIPFVRVDLYIIEGKVYFGELTFYPSSGFEGFKPPEWDEKLGDLIHLPIGDSNEK